MLIKLCDINSDFVGYQKLINLYQTGKINFLEDIQVSFEKWFSANLCAPLGAIFDKLKAETCGNIKFEYIPDDIKSVLQKNKFLLHYGFSKVTDYNNTAIEFVKLQPNDGRYFKNIVEKLINRPELPDLSNALKKKITESVYEMFVNAQIHSKTEFIYTCGQFFPNKHSIWFTIVDLGVGFKAKINERFGQNFSAKKAIEWAVQSGHTTKVKVSGGLGLSMLKEFITNNRGQMQIVSGDGFYGFNSTGEFVRDFDGEFPGTIITMEFKTDDKNSYCLSSEIQAKDIF